MFALKDRLMRTVGAGDVATNRALLRSIPAVNILHPYSFGFSFVSDKLLKLEEIPFVQLLTLFLAKPGSLPDRL